MASLVKNGGPSLYYKNTGVLYYTTFTKEPPECFINGTREPSSRETRLQLIDDTVQAAMHCLLNSSLFFTLHQMHSNCRDLNPSDIRLFRFPEMLLDDEALGPLSDRLHRDQQRNSRFRVRNQKQTGEVRLQTFYPALSKRLVDEIDVILARHFDFTPEEVDFVVNYDIKYRIGVDGDEA